MHEGVVKPFEEPLQHQLVEELKTEEHKQENAEVEQPNVKTINEGKVVPDI